MVDEIDALQVQEFLDQANAPLGAKAKNSEPESDSLHSPTSIKGVLLYPEQVTTKIETQIFREVGMMKKKKLKILASELPVLSPRDKRIPIFFKRLNRTTLIEQEKKQILKAPFLIRGKKRDLRTSKLFSLDFEAQGSRDFSVEKFILALGSIGRSFSGISVRDAARGTRVGANITALLLSSSGQAKALALVNLVTELAEYSDLSTESLSDINIESLASSIEGILSAIRGKGVDIYNMIGETKREVFASVDRDAVPRDFDAQGITETIMALPSEALGLVARIFLALYAFMFDERVKTLDFLSSKWQESLNRTFKATSSVPEILSFILTMFKKTAEWFSIYVLGQDPDYDQVLSSLDSAYDKWKEELWNLLDVYEDSLTGVAINPACRKRVMEHHEEGRVLCELIEKEKGISKNTYAHFMALFAKSDKMYRLAQTYNQATKFRVPSYMFQFTGGTGVGKTTCLNRVAMALNEAFEFGFEEGNLIYTRCQSSQYWEGYHGQMMTLYDDLFQNKDITKRGELAQELIFVCNSSPVALDMAAVESKGKVVFSSPFIAATTNIQKERSLNVACPEAFWRRFNSRWELFFDKQFLIDGKPSTRLMQEYTGEADATEARYKCLKCKLLDTTKVLTFEEMVDYIIQDAKVYIADEREIIRANEAFLQSHKGKVAYAHVMEAEEVPELVTIEVDGKEYSIEPMIEPVALTAQSVLSTPFIPTNTEVMGEQVVMYLSVDQVLSVTGQALEKVVPKKYNFLRQTEYARDLRKLSGLRRYDSLSYFWLLIYMVYFKVLDLYCYLFISQKDTRLSVRQRLDSNKPNSKSLWITALLAAVSLGVGVYGVKKVSHWAFTSWDAQSREYEKISPGRRRYLRRKAGTRRWFKRHFEGQGTEDDGYMHNIYQAICKISVASDGVTHSQRGFVVNGAAVLCTRHFVRYLESLKEDSMYSNSVIHFEANNMKRDIPLRLVKWTEPDDESGYDVAMLDFTKLIPPRKSIINYFICADDIRRVKLERTKMVSARVNSKGFVIGETTNLIKTRYSEESPTYSASNDYYNAYNVYMYDNFSENGACGSVLLHEDRSISGSILGIHVAGSSSRSTGISQAVTREMVEEMLSCLDISYERVRYPTAGPLSEKQQEDLVDLHQIEFIGQMSAKEGVRMATKTKLRKSKVFDQIVPHSTIPAMLTKEGEISPVMRALDKSNVPPGNFDPGIFSKVEEQMLAVYNHLPHKGYARTLSYFETANGIRGTTHLRPIDISTSCGYPHVLYRKGLGKRDQMSMIYGRYGEELTFKKEFFAEMQEHERMLELGKIPFYLFTASLKDERRPIEKVLAGKTRMFSAGNILLLCLCRRYYGGFLAFLTANSETLSSKVGSDLAGVDMDYIYKYCVKNRTSDEVLNNWLAGDFSGFDSSIMNHLISSFFECACKWYQFHRPAKGPGAENFERDQRIRSHLARAYDGPIHILGRTLFSLGKGNTSGNFATVHINGHANELVHRYSYYVLAERNGYDGLSFSREVNLITYGDDSLGVVSDNVKGWYNGATMAPILLSHFGMKYTDASKGDSLGLNTRQEAVFCKRHFKYHKDVGKIVGVMPIDDVLEVTNWIRDCPEPDTATLENIDFAHMELFLYGRTVYEKYSKIFQTIAAKNELLFVPKSYGERKREFLNR